MEETEKMMALKKAYAEIILNTAKEAAARIMVSERKAQLYNRDLVSMKDEALRLLLRLKQTMDIKINEVEMKSRDQQRQIEVLEAQLQEAEDIVSNLRVELNEAHMKLDVLSNNKTYLENQNGNWQPGNRSYEPDLASKAYQINHDAQGHSSANIYLEESGYLGEPEIPSIIRRKEPMRYLNGCTRLRTCDGNSLKDHLRNVKALREDKEGENVCVNTPMVADITCIEEEKQVDTKEVEDEEPVELMQVFKLLKKTKRGSRYETNNVSPLKRVSHMANKTCSDLFTSHDHVPGSHNMNESDNGDKIIYSNSPSIAPSDVSEMDTLPEHGSCFRSDDKLTEGMSEDREANGSLAMSTQQSTSGGSLNALGSSRETEMKNPSSLNVDVKLLEFSDGLSSPPSKDKVLKYTFQRKRKRESVASDENTLLHDENPLMERMAKKQNGNLEHVKSGEVTESLRDGRRMAEVAHQLISMSEKKWIK